MLMYGGTQAEMQRLIADAAELSDTVDAQSMSFDNIVEAIHVVQTEMGITGTTAKEAGTTIQGSVASMKSAWENLLTGLADGNADIEQLVDNLVTTIVGDGTETNLGVLGNILPAVKTALNGASTLISEALPEIVGIIPTIINENLPVLAQSAVGIIQSLADGISKNKKMLFGTILDVVTYLAETFIEMLPQIVELGLELIISLADGISESLPELIPTIVDVVIQIVESLIDNVDMLVDAAIAIITALANGLISSLPGLIEKAPDIVGKLVSAIVNNAPKLIRSSVELISTLAKGLISNIPALISAIPQIVMSIVNGFASLMSNVTEIGASIVTAIGNGITNLASSALTWGKDLIDNFVSGIRSKISAVTSAVSSVASKVKGFLGFSEPEEGPLSNFHTYAPDMMKLFAQGIRDNENVITDQIDKSFDFGERTIKFGAEYGGGLGTASANGSTFGGTSIGNVTINIDGAKYSNENSLAESIAEALQNMTDRRAAVYA